MAAYINVQGRHPTQNGRSGFPKTACQPKLGLANWTAPKLPLANSHSWPHPAGRGGYPFLII